MTASESQTKSGCPMPGHGAVSLADSTLADPMIQAQPNAFYAALRHEDPVHFDPKLNMYLVSRYDDIVTVLRDPLTYSDRSAEHTSELQSLLRTSYAVFRLKKK